MVLLAFLHELVDELLHIQLVFLVEFLLNILSFEIIALYLFVQDIDQFLLCNALFLEFLLQLFVLLLIYQVQVFLLFKVGHNINQFLLHILV